MILPYNGTTEHGVQSLERNEMPCPLLDAVRFVTAMAWMCGAQMRPSRQGNLEVRSTV